MIVADTNLIAYLLIDGDRSAEAKAVWTRDADWRVPVIWRSEFFNVLTTGMRARVLAPQQARETWQVALAVIGERELDVPGEDVLDEAMKRGLTAYDAQFVVAAIALDVPLVTSDRRLLRGAADVAVSAADFVRR